MRTKRKKPIVFIVILAIIAMLLIYVFAFKYPTYKITNDAPYSEALEIDSAIYTRTYWRGDYWSDGTFKKLIGFADSPEWGIYIDSDPDYSDFVILRYHYSLDHKPQPIMLKKEKSPILEPCAANTVSITFYDHKNPRTTIHDDALIDDIFSALETFSSVTVSDLSTDREYYGSIFISNDKLSRLTFDLKLIQWNQTNTYYLAIYNQNKLVPIPKELGKELRGYLK